MISEVFADSQGWIALLNRSDQHHPAAVELMTALAQQNRRVVTTDWILAETGNGLARTSARTAFAEAVRRLRTSANVTIIKIDDRHFEQALVLYK